MNISKSLTRHGNKLLVASVVVALAGYAWHQVGVSPSVGSCGGGDKKPLPINESDTNPTWCFEALPYSKFEKFLAGSSVSTNPIDVISGRSGGDKESQKATKTTGDAARTTKEYVVDVLSSNLVTLGADQTCRWNLTSVEYMKFRERIVDYQAPASAQDTVEVPLDSTVEVPLPSRILLASNDIESTNEILKNVVSTLRTGQEVTVYVNTADGAFKSIVIVKTPCAFNLRRYTDGLQKIERLFVKLADKEMGCAQDGNVCRSYDVDTLVKRVDAFVGSSGLSGLQLETISSAVAKLDGTGSVTVITDGESGELAIPKKRNAHIALSEGSFKEYLAACENQNLAARRHQAEVSAIRKTYVDSQRISTRPIAELEKESATLFPYKMFVRNCPIGYSEDVQAALKAALGETNQAFCLKPTDAEATGEYDNQKASVIKPWLCNK